MLYTIKKEYVENKIKCENCGRFFTGEDWPYSFRGLAYLCKKCKAKASKILNLQDR